MTESVDQSSPLDTSGLCLLSLDGGGVRGLSTLYILKLLMDRLNHERKARGLGSVKPCEVFHLIGGTSTGGLIAIMLGRLEMTVDECIEAYSELAEQVFREKKSRLPFNRWGKVKPRFDSTKLKDAIQGILAKKGKSMTELFNDGARRSCRTFVCAAKSNTKSISRLRSYSLFDEPNIEATIVQAALATSAAPTFFDPVDIGDQIFVDGGLGSNNPVKQVGGEASNIWCTDTTDLKQRVNCFVSIGTGNPGVEAFQDSILGFIGKTLKDIATETEKTEKEFAETWSAHVDKRYFRFNVQQGLQGVALDEYKRKGDIKATTHDYLTHRTQKIQFGKCIQNLALKTTEDLFSISETIKENKEAQAAKSLEVSNRPASWIVPFQRNTKFVGRNPEIANVNNWIATDVRCEGVAIYGLGGVGKTQIALQVVRQLRERDPDCSIFWVGKELQIPNIDNEKEDLEKKVLNRLNEESSGKWVLVFDNADDITLWTRQRINYLPKSKYGTIIFTTRSRQVGVDLTRNNLVLVGQMDEDMALELLGTLLWDPKGDLLADSNATKELLQKLTYLPLAIVQAVAYISQNDIRIPEHSELLDDTEKNVVDVLSHDFEDEGRYEGTKNPIATTWLISINQIEKQNSLAIEFLSFISCLDTKDIPKSILPPAETKDMAIRAFGVLSAYSFITKQENPEFFDLHRLVSLSTRNWLRTHGKLDEWERRAGRKLEEVLPVNPDDSQDRSTWRRYLPHAHQILNRLKNRDEHGEEEADLVSKFGTCMSVDGKFPQAIDAYSRERDIRKRIFGKEHPYTIRAMASLASACAKQGMLKDAQELYTQVIELSSRVNGSEHENTLVYSHNFALLRRDQGKREEAEVLLRQVLEVRKRNLELEHPDVLVTLQQLARALAQQGKLDEAESIFIPTLESSERVLGAEHPDTLTCRHNLAQLYLMQARWEEAERLFSQALEVEKRGLGDEHPDTLTSMNSLALTYRNQKRHKEAEDLDLQVLEASKRVLGSEHPDTLTSMGNLALTYRNQKRHKEAEELELQVLEARKRVLGVEHPDTLTCMNNLACTWKNLGREEEAFQLMEECLELKVRVLGDDHEATLNSRKWLLLWEEEREGEIVEETESEWESTDEEEEETEPTES